MLASELITFVLELQNDAYTKLGQNLMASQMLSQEYC